ncbi:DJ-1/PfpI family protein [Endozoicomonas ascidiicola]|uniref:DJ-1/PfpI family protein n=1 Tax=Endozoicomonas ascidiicola TaxID=1698521 RepID=UPI0008329134|nr:DJ-1/PfpI family protein [Endozoicomonas ascidiicola]
MGNDLATTKRIAVLLADGFEEAEAVVFIDIMRRLKINVDVLACKNERHVNSYFKVNITADFTLSEKFDDDYDAVMMPGGPEGTANLTSDEMVIGFLKRHIARGKLICPLCSSGAKVVAANGLFGQHKYVSGADFYKSFDDGVHVDQKVVVDGQFISGKGLGVVFDFSFIVAEHLIGKGDVEDKSSVRWQAQHIDYDGWPYAEQS